MSSFCCIGSKRVQMLCPPSFQFYKSGHKIWTRLDPIQQNETIGANSKHEQKENGKNLTSGMNAVVKRVSRSAYSPKSKHLGSDFVEDRIYRVKSVTPTNVDGMNEATIEIESPLLSHTCTTSSGVDSRTPTPASHGNGRVNIQEVTLTYICEKCASVPPATKSSRTSFSDYGGLDYDERKFSLNSVLPHRMDESGMTHYGIDEFIQISDTSDQNRSKPESYAVPLRVDTAPYKYKQQAHLRNASTDDVSRQRTIRFEDARNRTAHKPRQRVRNRAMSDWQNTDLYEHQRNEKSYEFEDVTHGKRSATSRTIYERTTSEVTMSKSTTTTFHPTARLKVPTSSFSPRSTSQPHQQSDHEFHYIHQHGDKRKQQEREWEERKENRTVEKQIPIIIISSSKDAKRFDPHPRSNIVKSQNLLSQNTKLPASFSWITPNFNSRKKSSLPRYDNDEIRIHARYDDDFVYAEGLGGLRRIIGRQPATERFTTNFPTAKDFTTFEERKSYIRSPPPTQQDSTRENLLQKMPPRPQCHYEYEEKEEHYYERISKRCPINVEKMSTESTGKSQEQIMPYGSTKNFSDVAASSGCDEREINREFSSSSGFTCPPPYTSPTTVSLPAVGEQSIIEKPLRFIDYDTYRQEVAQLQREAIQDSNDIDMPVPLTPAMVLFPRRDTSTMLSKLKYFTRTELGPKEATVAEDTSMSPKTMENTTISATLRLTADERAAAEDVKLTQQTEQDPVKEFDRKIEATHTSPGFRSLHQEVPTLASDQYSTRYDTEATKISSANIILTAKSKKKSDSMPEKNSITNISRNPLQKTQTTFSFTTTTDKEGIRQDQAAIEELKRSQMVKEKPFQSNREFRETERQDFSEYYRKPDSYRIASYMENYDFHHCQERSEESRKRRPIYIEKATKQNMDISIERVSPSQRQTKEKSAEKKVESGETETFTTTTSTTTKINDTTKSSTITTTFGVAPIELESIERSSRVQTRETGTGSHEIPIRTFETSTAKKSNGMSVETGTDMNFSLVPSREVGVQANVATGDDTTAGRELLETLRRELQYEEFIDLEVRRRRTVNELSAATEDQPLTPVREEEIDTYALASSTKDTDNVQILTNAVDDALIETYEPEIIREPIIGATSEKNEDQTHAAQLSMESIESLAVTQTTDVPSGQILADVLSDSETLLLDEQEYGSRTLTPSSQDRRPNSQSQLYQTMNQNVNIPYDIRSQSTQGEISDYYTHPRLPTYREYETRSLSAYSQTHPQSHITSFGSEQYLTREPMQRTSSLVASPARSESVSTKRNVTTFSPMTGVDRDPGVPLAPSVATTITNTTTTNMSSTPTIVTRHSRVRSSSPLRAQNAYAHQYNPRMEYGSGISHRQNFSGHHRRAISPPALSHRNIRTIQSETSSMSSGLFSPYGGSTAASIIRDAREREKKEMSELNDRLASYIEKVRFLEAQNRKLAADLDFLRNRWGRDTSSIRGMYEVDIKQAQKLIEDTENQREELLKTIYKLEEERSILQRKFEDAEKARYGDREEIDEALMKLSALEAEIALIKRRNGLIEEEIAHAKRENHRLLNDLQHARNDLDQQTLNRIDYQNQVQTLIEEIDFLRRAHDGEIHDLQAMASRDTTSENREYFRNELSSAIRDIRSEYDKVCNVQRVDMESWYKLKVQEIQTQSNRQNMEQNYVKEELRRLRVQMGELRSKSADLEGRNAMLEKQAEELNYQLEDEQRSYESALNDRDSQIRKIREECQMLMVELQMLLDTKQSLDAEIVIYHKTLEGEEDRAGLRQLVEQVPRTHHYKQSDESGIETTRLLRGETSSRQSYQRSAKGNVAIREVAHDGRFVVIENTHRSRAENISEWRFRRRIDNDKHEIHFTFPHGFILGPAKSVKIWARNQGPFNPPDELVFDAEESFGVGNNVQNFLYNAQGEERASLIQRSSH